MHDKHFKSLKDYQDEIYLLMDYAVPEKMMHDAKALVSQYEGDIIGLNLLHSFYSYLPEAQDDAIHTIILLERRKSTFLLCAVTLLNPYLYLVTNESAEYLGTLQEGIWDQDVLNFFGFKDRDSFIKAHQEISKLEIYAPATLNGYLCPVCHAEKGEYHVLGCPVEICPWCNGQLTSCNCRFTQLNIEALDKIPHLDALEEQINAKGRIAFDPATQMPSFPSTVENLKDKE